LSFKICTLCKREYRSTKDYVTFGQRFRKCDRDHIWFNCTCGSTLLLPQDMTSVYLPEKHFSKGAAALFLELEGLKTLPTLSNAVPEFEAALAKEHTEAHTLAQIALKDPAFAAKLFSFCNLDDTSPSHAFSAEGAKTHSAVSIGRNTNLAMAIGRLGRERLKALILPASLPHPKWQFVHFSLAWHWQHALCAGQIARKLYKRVYPGAETDLVYLAAVLCNVGRVVLGFVAPGALDFVSLKVKTQKIPWRQAEVEQDTYNHQLLGEIGCYLWGLPNEVCFVASQHHQPEFFIEPQKKLAETRKFERLAALEPLQVLVYLVNLSNEIAFDQLETPWRKNSSTKIHTTGVRALYEANTAPSSFVGINQLESFAAASRVLAAGS
jgi:HD-like signal output (HDOD) protein